MGWRITEEDEVEGIDLATHGETAYETRPAAACPDPASVTKTEEDKA